jgi:hypothetical protein
MEREPKTAPEGFRLVHFTADLPLLDEVAMTGLVPDGDKYPEEAIRLSRKALRGSPYTQDEFHEGLGLNVKWREKVWTNPLLPNVKYYLRELHDAISPPQTSLLQIQFLVVFPWQSGQNGPSMGIDYMVYSPGSDGLLHSRLSDVPVDIDIRNLEEGIALDNEFGLTEEIGDKQRAFLYAQLLEAAGEKGPK